MKFLIKINYLTRILFIVIPRIKIILIIKLIMSRTLVLQTPHLFHTLKRSKNDLLPDKKLLELKLERLINREFNNLKFQKKKKRKR